MSSEEERPVAWLRAQVEARLALAREAADGDSGQWFMGRKWNVYRAEDEACYDDDYQGEENRLVTWGNVKPQSEHIALNDPRDTIARCEAELAILDLHRPTWEGCSPDWQECRECGPNNDSPGLLAAPGEGEPSWWPCRTVRLLAGGYKYRPGFPAAFSA